MESRNKSPIKKPDSMSEEEFNDWLSDMYDQFITEKPESRDDFKEFEKFVKER
jgi:hypothetical protein